MPSVTTNDGSDQVTLTRPLIAPHAAPAASAASNAIGNGTCHFTMSVPSTAPDSASTEPTDRSIPPMTSTYVMPTAVSTVAGIWLAIVVNVFAEKK